MVYVPDTDWGGQTAFSDAPGEGVFVPELDWENQTPASDEPWEVTCLDTDAFADTLEASF